MPVTRENAEAVDGAVLVVVSVKPQDIEALLAEVSGRVTPEQTVLSVAAAIPTAAIERHLSGEHPGRPRDAERAIDRARGDRRHLRRRARG